MPILVSVTPFMLTAIETALHHHKGNNAGLCTQLHLCGQSCRDPVSRSILTNGCRDGS